jgi:hypothetical protein
MLSKCANPACFNRFRYLHEGRIFNVEIKSEESVRPAQSRIEHFWLCASCAQMMKVVWENGKVTTRPRYLALPLERRREEKRIDPGQAREVA